ncbi:DUF5958 family protein [Streptomyces sp. NPDC012950]|uniref:DUF5958 family protein n=1 Tax=Streptomyces sp. NPDC012950 TaxID=3364858 RepID=UPI0036A6CA84
MPPRGGGSGTGLLPAGGVRPGRTPDRRRRHPDAAPGHDVHLRHHCVQARALAEGGPESISRAGLRPTHTPAVLISRGRIDEQLGKIVGLTPSTNAARRSGS